MQSFTNAEAGGFVQSNQSSLDVKGKKRVYSKRVTSVMNSELTDILKQKINL